MARAMKDSRIAWVGEIPKDWNSEKAKYHFQNTKYIPGSKSTEYERLALTLKGVIKREKEDANGLQPKDFDTYQLLRTNELVFKLIDLQNVSTSRVGLSPYTGLVSPAYIIIRASGSILPSFAEKYFLMLWHREIFNALGDNGVRSNLGSSDLLNIPICYPTKDEQHSISVFIDTECAEIDTLIADIQAQIETLEQYKRSVITEAVTKGLNPNVPMKDSGTDWMGMVPRNWVRTRIKYCLCEIDMRSITGKEEPLSMSQRFGIIPTSQIDVPHSLASYVGAKITHPGDLVFNKLKAHLGVFSVSQYTGLVSPDYAVYRAYENVNAKYLEYLFKTDACIAEFKKRITGVGQGLSRLYTSDLFAICVAIPQKVEQDTIVKMLDAKCAEIDTIIDGKRQQLSTLEEYKKSIIFEYVTGKKEVPISCPQSAMKQ